MQITLTGLGGTGTSTVGRMIAEELNIPFKSGGNFQREAAAAHGMSLYEWDEYLKEHHEEDAKVEAMQKDFAEHTPSFVLESLLSWYVAPKAFNVRMDCALDTRIARVAERESISFEDAKRLNAERVGTYNDRYGPLYNIEDFVSLPDEHFDFIIDTTHIPAAQVAEEIIKQAQHHYDNKQS